MMQTAEAIALAIKARSFARWLRSEKRDDIRPEPDDYDELAGAIEHLVHRLKRETSHGPR